MWRTPPGHGTGNWVFLYVHQACIESLEPPFVDLHAATWVDEDRVEITIAVNAIKEAAGLPKDFHPLHGLRHVYAQMLASSGEVDMYPFRRLLTHKSPLMTQRYAHLRDDALKRAFRLAGRLIEEVANNKKGKNVSSMKNHKN